jgi:hypothetical protein
MTKLYYSHTPPENAPADAGVCIVVRWEPDDATLYPKSWINTVSDALVGNAPLRSLVVLNSEHIKFRPDLSDIEIQDGIEYYLDLIKQVRTRYPGLRVGLYNRAPQRLDPAAIAMPGFSAKWRAISEQCRVITDKCDYICPSLYWLTTNVAEWSAFALVNHAEASGYAGKKPVIPFFMNRYHKALTEDDIIPLTPQAQTAQWDFIYNSCTHAVLYGPDW